MPARSALCLALACVLLLVATASGLAEDEFEPGPSLARLSADDAYGRRSGRSLRDLALHSCSAIEVDDAGRVLVAGVRGETPCVVRLDGDGRIDTTFGNSGLAELFVITGLWHGAPGLSFDVDAVGRIVVIVNYSTWEGAWCSVVRLRADGTLDPSFAEGGVLHRGPGTEPFLGGPIHVVGREGAMLVFAGTRAAAGSGDWVYGLVRITADGAVDPEYGGGFARVGPWVSDGFSAPDFAVDAEGRAVVTWKQSFPGGYNVTRLDATGEIDTAFRAAAGAYNERAPTFRATQVALDAAGRIVALDEFGFRRRLASGAPDPEFSEDGYARRHEPAGFQGGASFYQQFIRDYGGWQYFSEVPVTARLAVATDADRWAIATPAPARRSRFRHHYASPLSSFRGDLAADIRIQAIDPEDPGAIITTTCRAPRVRASGDLLVGLAITSDGTTAYALGEGFVARVDLTTRKPRALPDVSARWLGVPRAIDLGDGRCRVTGRVRLRNRSRRIVKVVRSHATLDFPADVEPLEIQGRWTSGLWRPFRIRQGASVVRRVRWEGGGLTTAFPGSRLTIEVACELPDANFADNVAVSGPMTPVLR